MWSCFAYDCELELITIPGTLNPRRYQDNTLDVAVILGFDINAQVSRPIARPYCAMAVVIGSPDPNTIEHLWDIIDHQVRLGDPTAQNLQELTKLSTGNGREFQCIWDTVGRLAIWVGVLQM